MAANDYHILFVILAVQQNLTESNIKWNPNTYAWKASYSIFCFDYFERRPRY